MLGCDEITINNTSYGSIVSVLHISTCILNVTNNIVSTCYFAAFE